MSPEAVERFFCSEASRRRGEQIFATAPNVDTWFLLEYHGRWNADALPVSELPPEVRNWLGELTRRVRRSRVLLIRQSYVRRPTIQFFVAHSSERGARMTRFELSCYQDLFSVDLERGRAHTEPMYLVCTHGKHDKCCALFGLPVYRALREITGGGAWECTHVGGDRFAGNVIAMPEGAYYGHVFPGDAAGLSSAHAARTVLLEHFRGRCCFGRTAQAGEYFARMESGLRGFDQLRFRDGSLIEPERWRVRFEGDSGVHSVEFRRVREDRVGLFTCHAEKTQGLAHFELTGYTVES